MQNNETPGKIIVPVPLGGHKLPPLRYPYDALEPIIDSNTLKIHHDKHHKKYVDDLNKAEISAQSIRNSADYAAIHLVEAQLAYNGSGHILHSIYWTTMTYPDRGGSPGRLTERMITLYFGSFEKFKAQFTAAAIGVFGSGWGILVYNPFFRHLEILTAERHENLAQWGAIPILVCDVWEQDKVNMVTINFLLNLQIIHIVIFCSSIYFLTLANSSLYLNLTSILSLL